MLQECHLNCSCNVKKKITFLALLFANGHPTWDPPTGKSQVKPLPQTIPIPLSQILFIWSCFFSPNWQPTYKTWIMVVMTCVPPSIHHLSVLTRSASHSHTRPPRRWPQTSGRVNCCYGGQSQHLSEGRGEGELLSCAWKMDTCSFGMCGCKWWRPTQNMHKPETGISLLSRLQYAVVSKILMGAWCIPQQ